MYYKSDLYISKFKTQVKVCDCKDCEVIEVFCKIKSLFCVASRHESFYFLTGCSIYGSYTKFKIMCKICTFASLVRYRK